MRGEKVLRAALVAATLAFAACCVPGIRAVLPGSTGLTLISVIGLVAPALVVNRAIRVRRLSPTLVAAGLTSYTVASVYSWIATARGTPLPFPSIGDVGWLLLYPLLCAGIVAAMWIPGDMRRLRTLLDGAIAGFGGAALFAQLSLDVVIPPVHSHGLEGLTLLAYPIGDALLVATVLCMLTVHGRATHRGIRFTCLGVVAFAVGDTWYVALASGGGYQPGTVADLPYLVGLSMLGLSTGYGGPPRNRPPPQQADLRLVLPATFALTSLALVLFGTQHHISPVSAFLAGVTLLSGIVRGVVSIRHAEALSDTQHREARLDELTGLGNRRAYQEYLDGRLAERPAPQAGVLLLDLDRFKEVNDSFGHQVGDQLLREAAGRLRDAVRAEDLLARLGGDEFVVVVTGQTLLEERLDRLATRLRDTLRQPFDIGGRRVQIDASIGLAYATGTAEDSGLLLQHADIAMYKAKQAREGHGWYTDNSDVEHRHRLELLDQLHRDIGTDAIVLHYQPKIALGDGSVVGMEALVRWQRVGQPLLYPDTFLPLAEAAGLMPDLTRNVLDLAVRQCVRWRNSGLELSVAVNVSTADLSDPNFPNQVLALLQHHGLPTQALVVEVTETVMMHENDHCWTVIEELGGLGVGVSIDDYGTDYASLTYLQRLLSARELKLDRRFVSRVAEDPRSGAIVKSSVDLAHMLGMAVVAEGVETAEVLSRLTDWGCDMAQGYYVSRPKPAAEIEEWLRTRRIGAPVVRRLPV